MKKYAGGDFVAIMKCENIVVPAWAGENTVGPFGLTLDAPADLQESGEYLPSLG